MKRKDAYYHVVVIVEDDELLHGITYAYAVEIPNRGSKEATEHYAYEFLIDEYGIYPGYVQRHRVFDTSLEAEEYAFNENTDTRNNERWYKIRAEQEYKAEQDRMDILDNLRMGDLLKINAETGHDIGIEMPSKGSEEEDKRFMKHIMDAYDKMNHDNEEDELL